MGGQDQVTVAGVIQSRKGLKSQKGLSLLRATIQDSYGAKLDLVWFNQPWLEKQLYPGLSIIAFGKLKQKSRHLELQVQHMEVDDDSESLSTGRIVSIYQSTQGLSQAYIRRSVFELLKELGRIPDYLPKKILQDSYLIPLSQALHYIHFPPSEKDLQQALRRLKFDEFLFLELRILRNRDHENLGKKHKVYKYTTKEFSEHLPFKMTKAQSRVLKEIMDDMQSPKQMARLVQGDVGSGKTVVAAAAIYVSVKNSFQAALMAPTEILARQHFNNLRQYLFPLGVRLELLIGSMTKKQSDLVKAALKSGEIDVIIGTQALIQEDVHFKDLGLAVIDEEHRFGVDQRRKLLAGKPDVLVMSATPIPRSLALTYYGDLDLSIIDELPPGRKAIHTRLVNDSKRRDVYRFAWGEIKKGRQVYVVTPLIEESEAEVMAEIVSAEQMYADLLAIMPPECRLGLLHGKLSGSEKDEMMARFYRHELDMLVSTTVIEVGVDVPNATLMIIENAERFGLSQLHQLRGRVGRGSHESYCILIAGDRSKKTHQRLEVIEKYHDGFIIAEKDLALRGPGDLKGTRQSGMPDLVLGDLSQDIDIIEKAKELAEKIVATDRNLEAAWAERLRTELTRRIKLTSLREIM
ncbi:MAG: ATP-dependent DNA helicase RecG [Deinococcales bacterium]